MPDRSLLNGILAEVIRREETECRRGGTAFSLGMQMVQAAKAFVGSPTRHALQAFETLEDEWRTLHPKARRRYANAFRAALGEAPLRPTSYAGNTPFNKDWNPPRGFVYGFWSHDHPGLIKLGATSEHPTDRLKNFNRKYKLNHLKIAFFFEVTAPAAVERHWTTGLTTYRQWVGNTGSREWYAMTPKEALQHVRAAIAATGVKRLGCKYVLKDMDSWKDVDFWPQGPKRFGAHIVSKQP